MADFYRADFQSFLVGAGVTIDFYDLVQVNASGYLEVATDSASKIVVGFAVADVDNSAGLDGAESCTVKMLCKGDVKTHNLTQADIMSKVYVRDFETVQSAGDSTNSNLVGFLTEIDILNNTGKVLLERGF